MSTKFIIAYEKATDTKVALVDSDAPEQLFEVLVSRVLAGEQFNPNDYQFVLTDWKMDVIDKDWDWTDVPTTVTFGALFGKKDKKR